MFSCYINGHNREPSLVILVQSKREFTRSAISNHQYSSKRFTIYPFQTAQSNNISASLGSIHYDAIDARRLFVHNNPPLCITCYSFMQLIDLRHRRVKQHAQNVHSSLNPGYEPGFAQYTHTHARTHARTHRHTHTHTHTHTHIILNYDRVFCVSIP